MMIADNIKRIVLLNHWSSLSAPMVGKREGLFNLIIAIVILNGTVQ
jgi:hypothetical protein